MILDNANCSRQWAQIHMMWTRYRRRCGTGTIVSLAFLSALVIVITGYGGFAIGKGRGAKQAEIDAQKK